MPGRVLHRDEETDGGVSTPGAECCGKHHVILQAVTADLSGGRSVRDSFRLLASSLPLNVPGSQVLLQVLQLARNPQEAGESRRPDDVPVRWQ